LTRNPSLVSVLVADVLLDGLDTILTGDASLDQVNIQGCQECLRRQLLTERGVTIARSRRKTV
jgi:hypothetical protein